MKRQGLLLNLEELVRVCVVPLALYIKIWSIVYFYTRFQDLGLRERTPFIVVVT